MPSSHHSCIEFLPGPQGGSKKERRNEEHQPCTATIRIHVLSSCLIAGMFHCLPTGSELGHSNVRIAWHPRREFAKSKMLSVSEHDLRNFVLVLCGLREVKVAKRGEDNPDCPKPKGQLKWFGQKLG
jgi:hypothetical protein